MSGKSRVDLLTYITYVGAGTATLLSTIAIAFSYDKSTNYFTTNSILFPLATAVAILTFALAIAAALMTPKENLVAISPFGSNLLTALPAALGFGIGAIFSILEFVKSNFALLLVTTVFLLLSATYVLLSETERVSTFWGFAPPIACALMVGVLYFDTSLEMNAPLKVAVQTALLPLMLYFTAELRYLLKREIPRLFLALALVSVSLASLCVLAVPTACLMGVLENTNCLAGSIIVAGTNITILLKLKKYLHMTPSHENDTKETDAQ